MNQSPLIIEKNYQSNELFSFILLEDHQVYLRFFLLRSQVQDECSVCYFSRQHAADLPG